MIIRDADFPRKRLIVGCTAIDATDYDCRSSAAILTFSIMSPPTGMLSIEIR